jgi:hypothetical protein
MKTASETTVSQINTAFKDNPPKDAAETVAGRLRTVANAFIQAQQRRNDADYNMSKEWTPVEVEKQIASVREAFRSWLSIRNNGDPPPGVHFATWQELEDRLSLNPRRHRMLAGFRQLRCRYPAFANREWPVSPLPTGE